MVTAESSGKTRFDIELTLHFVWFALGLHDWCDEPSAAQESAPKKKATRKSAKKESK